MIFLACAFIYCVLFKERLETKKIPGDDLDMDAILKPFPSTSAFNHCKSQLNWFQGLLQADSQLVC